MIIDFHTHIFPPKIKAERGYHPPPDPTFPLLYSQPKSQIATVEELISSMDECGIDISVILNIGWVKQEMCQETNDYILEAITRYPHRLVGFISIQPLAGERALKEIERCSREGIRGIGEIRPDTQGFTLEDKALWQPIIEQIKKHRLILLIHSSEPVGHHYPGKGENTPKVLYPFITQFPEVTVVCAHWGGGLPFYALMPEVDSALTNVYFDTAASPFLYKPAIFYHVSQLIGAHKILFGSDYPLLSPRRYLEQIQALDLKELDKAMILGNNAWRLLFD